MIYIACVDEMMAKIHHRFRKAEMNFKTRNSSKKKVQTLESLLIRDQICNLRSYFTVENFLHDFVYEEKMMQLSL